MICGLREYRGQSKSNVGGSSGSNSLVRLAFLHLFLCASCFLAFAQPDSKVSTGLQPGDQVRIRSVGAHRDNDVPVRIDQLVDGDGRLSLPEFGLVLDVLDIQAADVSVAIRDGLRKASGRPRLQVTVLSSRNGLPLPEQRCLTVGGRVRDPGPIPYRPGITLAESLAAAGGTTESSATKRIKVYRGGEEVSYDLHNPAHAALRLWPHDIIEVPAKFWAGR